MRAFYFDHQRLIGYTPYGLWFIWDDWDDYDGREEFFEEQRLLDDPMEEELLHDDDFHEFVDSYNSGQK